MAPPHADTFDDLLVYRKARQLSKQIFELSAGFPQVEAFALTSQIRRASRSIGAQIAEAWAKRRYEKLFVSKLTDADGEQHETQHWIQTAMDRGYLPSDAGIILRQDCREIGRLLAGMIAKANLFCSHPPRNLREEGGEYIIPLPDSPHTANLG
jgi:four helix bundle protein